jgi:hypothetical protein
VIAGESASRSGIDPKRLRTSSQRRTAPGTETERIPDDGIVLWLRPAKKAGVALLPAPPLPLMA